MIQGTYIVVQFFIEDNAFREMILAELAWLGFDAIEEHDHGVTAHTTPEQLDTQPLDDLVKHYSQHTSIHYTTDTQQAINWNEAWEKSYQPIEVGDIRIRASFHPPDPSYPLELIINPKMSFGTGHHATTRLMLELLQQHPPVGLSVLDIGTGSGILAIAALKLGAKDVVGLDVDDWVVENAQENAVLNNVRAAFNKGTLREYASSLSPVGMILANINRQILLDEMELYAQMLLPRGQLFLSGILDEDLVDIQQAMAKMGILSQEVRKDPTHWIAVNGIRK